ncbi:MAG: gamma-glutamyl-gamma-aminobutyrate hydrolase family protein [Deltaproteobacteria bacterium]|nr:gamma-glutamyl-gamma-aminobutyrate hydrolase family protein [Deltaproteobacteria bacterium]MBI2087982.1 gamma-glutamyl-gamma-aminobutyrate hydrolase family protein [Deltaproteobacteria bacterium]
MRRKTGRFSPLIGITPDVESLPGASPPGTANRVIELPERYARAILDTGGLPLILPITSVRSAIKETLAHLDGVLVSGGNFDIDPAYYGEAAIQALGKVNEERTRFELELIGLALERNLPLLGVCGGAQAINVACGGTLYQDITTEMPQALEHQQGARRYQGGHPVQIHDGTLLKRIVGRDQLEANTTHHQAVKQLGKGLIVNATAEDGVIEGLESTNHGFVIGLQWHPECLIDIDACQKKIFTAFISASKKQR